MPGTNHSYSNALSWQVAGEATVILEHCVRKAMTYCSRRRGFNLPSYRHSIFPDTTLVLPLSCFPRVGDLKCRYFNFDFPIPDSWRSICSSYFVISLFTYRAESLARIGEAVPETNSSDRSNFRQILSIKTVHVLAFFILVYVGVEVTIGGEFIFFSFAPWLRQYSTIS